MTVSKYTFERTELRVMQNQAKDNEEFLNMVADLVGSLTEERDKWKEQAQWYSGQEGVRD